jgi:oligo-1,6-glucosidase
VVVGRFRLLLPDHDQLWVFTRTLGDEVLLVLANCSSAPAEVGAELVADLTGSTVLLATHEEAETAKLLPWESRVLRLRGPGS